MQYKPRQCTRFQRSQEPETYILPNLVHDADTIQIQPIQCSASKDPVAAGKRGKAGDELPTAAN